MINTELYGDTQEQIEKCLNCPYPQCINCAARNSPAVERLVTAQPRKPKTQTEEIVYLFYLDGLYDTDIARVSGLNVNTVRKARINMGYPTLPRRASVEDRKTMVEKWK